MILAIFANFHHFSENDDISLKSAIFAKNAKIAYFNFLTEVGPKVIIFGGQNVELQQHSQPWAENEHIYIIFTKNHNY